MPTIPNTMQENTETTCLCTLVHRLPGTIAHTCAFCGATFDPVSKAWTAKVDTSEFPVPAKKSGPTDATTK